MATYADLLTAPAVGFVLTLDGCEYAFGGGGVSSVAFTGTRDEDWCQSDEPVQWTIVPHALDTSDLKWTERVKPIDGELDAGQLAFRLHDVTVATGSAAGYPVLSYLARNGDDVTGSPLAATISAGATTITVADGTPFGTSNFVIWVDREAIRISSRTGTTLTVASSGRGVYGSKARAHTYTVETDGGAAEVFASFPFLARRRAILWAGSLAAGVLTDPVPLWRGHVSVAPRLAQGGAMVELQCDHLSAGLGDVVLGAPMVGCRMAGYYSDGAVGHAGLVTVTLDGDVNGAVRHGQLANATPDAYFATLDELAADLQAGAVATMASLAPPVTGTLTIAAVGATLNLRARFNDAARVQVGVMAAPCFARSGADGREFSPTSGSVVEIEPINLEMGTAVARASAVEAKAIHMMSVADLPTTWPRATGGATGEVSTSSQAVLASAAGDYRVLIVPTTADIAGDTVVDTTDKTVKGVVELYEKDGHTPVFGQSVDGVWYDWGDASGFLLGARQFAFTLKIRTTSWIHAVETAIVGDTLLVGSAAEIDVDARDWTWDRAPRVRAALPGNLQSREWLLDGTQNLRDLLAVNLQLSGGALAIRRSRLAPDVFLPPARSDTVDAAHTIGIPEQTKAPGWSVLTDGIANGADVTIGEDDATKMRWIVNDRRSQAKYGARRRVELLLRGVEVTAEMRERGPRFLQYTLLQRILGLWSEPCEVIRVGVHPRYVDSVYLLDTVSVTDWLAPNGSGGRGGTRRGVVIGRDVDLSGELELEVLYWPRYQNTGGFAPCVRIEDIDDMVLTVATGYITGAGADGPTDYAGSNLPDYETLHGGRGCVADDGGTGFFAGEGFVAQLVLRDSTWMATETVYIGSVDAATRVISLTEAPSAEWNALVAEGRTVDLRWGPYASISDDQKGFAYVASHATHTIGGTSDKPMKWSP